MFITSASLSDQIIIGRGVVHGGGSEEEFKRTGGPVEAFQIWVNLPRSKKMVPPRYQDIKSANIPVVAAPNCRIGSSVKVISGSYEGTAGSCSTLHPVVFFDVRLQPGDTWTVPTPRGHVAFIYVYRGGCVVEGEAQRSYPLAAGSGGPLGDGDELTVSVRPDQPPVKVPAPHQNSPEFSHVGCAFILLMGEQIDEPIARSGPFVMNTQEEIEQCYVDFRSGRMAAESREL